MSHDTQTLKEQGAVVALHPLHELEHAFVTPEPHPHWLELLMTNMTCIF